MQLSTSKIFLISSRISTATGGSILSKSSIKKINPRLLLPVPLSSCKHFSIASSNDFLKFINSTDSPPFSHNESTPFSTPICLAATFAPIFATLPKRPETLFNTACDEFHVSVLQLLIFHSSILQ